MATRQLYIVIVMYCVSDYERSLTTALDAYRICDCSKYSCDFSQVCSPTPNCTKENVALGKPANMSSFWGYNEPSGPACLAVNGNTDTTYKPAKPTEKNPNCIHTGENDRNAYWLVNLGRNYTIKNITVYIRSGTSSRIDLVSITVDDQECYKFSTGTPATPLRKDVTCNAPRRGSVVKFYKNGVNQQEYLLNICEVQVWVCSAGFYGEECNFSCNSNCRDGISCDNYYGTCLSDEACSCSTGCNFTQSCNPVGNCRKDNVALGRPANMSSTWGPTDPSGPACVAVNGNIDTVYKPLVNGEQSPNCIHTGLDDRNAWWLVNLDRNYTVTDITVYIRTEQPLRMAGVVITVDDQLCYTFLTGVDSSSPKADITCSTPRKGSVVKFYKDGTGQPEYLLNFCEVQVWICRPGLYGINCEYKCNCKDNEICDNFYGSCTTGCSPGYYGFNCTLKCGRCKDNSACNSTNGNCMSGCQTGWEEPMCKKCSEWYYGINCSQRCGNCKVGSTCNSTNGQCLTGCETGWKAPMCTECSEGYYGYNCSQRCGNCKGVSSCNVLTGQCLSGCQEGWQEPICVVCKAGLYGANCSRTCGKCKNSPCNALDGVCLEGCQDGYETQFCNETCRNKTYGQNCSLQCGRCNNSAPCDVFNGSCTVCESYFNLSMCTECIHGYYGEDCNNPCGHCKDGEMCNNTDGVCPDGCEDGYEYPLCNHTCSNRMYGPNCSIECGHCLAEGSCNATNGVCPDGCDAGYNTTLCNEKCPNGTWGIQCNISCGNCNFYSCRHDNGTCENGCVPGFKGELCQYADSRDEPSSENKIGLIVGIVFGVILSVVILVGIIFIMRRHGYGFKARHLTSTGDRNSRLDSSNNSLAPLTSGPTANKSTVKPKVAVKPRIRDDTCGPVYENVVLGNSSRLDKQYQCQTDDAPSTSDMAVQEDDIFLEDSEQLYSNDEVVYAALKSSQNLDHIQRSLIDKLTSGALLQEFKHIKKDIRKSHQTALLPQNIKKNRFKVIVPYDCNRVILRDGYEDGDSTDYINSSFVKGVQSDTQYIAAQGPRDNTATDFWRMVLQERVTDIVMVTSLQEGGKSKCYEYWPAKDTTQIYGPIKVTGLDVQCRAYFYTRTFSLRLSDDDSKRAEHKVTQYHFTAWPDHGIPTETSLVDFWRFVKSRANACGVSAPLLVHCSAGVGRTGTYIGLDICMDECLQNGKINIAAIVDRMRDDRTTMVQTPEQYVFLYKALLEAYTGRGTKLSIDQFETVISRSISFLIPNERIDKEFQIVMQMRSLTAEQSHSIAIADENSSKNRSEAILPSDGHIVYLTEHMQKRNQYINAVYMSTFTKPRGAILTQLPLPDTLVDFWRMIFGNEVTTVVSLGDTCDETNIENFCRYWPLKKDAVKIGPYCVTLKSSSRLGKHLVTYTLTLNKQDVTKTREIQLLRYEGWSSEIPDKSDIYQLVEILDTNTTVVPIVIQCTDGGAKSGLFCCIRDIISRVTFDHDVDIYMTVRHVQSVRPEAVTKVDQYRFCYEVAQEKVREQNVYANI